MLLKTNILYEPLHSYKLRIKGSYKDPRLLLTRVKEKKKKFDGNVHFNLIETKSLWCRGTPTHPL